MDIWFSKSSSPCIIWRRIQSSWGTKRTGHLLKFQPALNAVLVLSEKSVKKTSRKRHIHTNFSISCGSQEKYEACCSILKASKIWAEVFGISTTSDFQMTVLLKNNFISLLRLDTFILLIFANKFDNCLFILRNSSERLMVFLPQHFPPYFQYGKKMFFSNGTLFHQCLPIAFSLNDLR